MAVTSDSLAAMYATMLNVPFHKPGESNRASNDIVHDIVRHSLLLVITLPDVESIMVRPTTSIMIVKCCGKISPRYCRNCSNALSTLAICRIFRSTVAHFRFLPRLIDNCINKSLSKWGSRHQKWRGDPEHADAYIRMYTQDWCDIETPSLSSFRRPVPTRRSLNPSDSIHNMVTM
jgi:hypothetical protein